MSKIIFLKCGLANRLRTLVGFVYVGLETNQEFIFHWDTKDAACNGLYSSIFAPLVVNYKGEKKEISIIETEFDSDLKYYFIGQDTTSSIIQKEASHLIPNSLNKANLFHSPYIKHIENILYSRIIPKKYIINKVNAYLKKNKEINQKITASMHIRRTDHSALAQKNNSFTDNEKFIKFINDNKDEYIFLATDDKETQTLYLTYPKVLVYKKIEKTDKLRQTTLEDAVIDILIAAVSTKFIGSGYSSYSHLIEIYRRINHLKSEYFYLYL